MGKKKGEENPKSEEPKEGCNLLGKPKFKKLENGRFKCVETGHELPAHAREAYAVSKHCRLGLINAALARSKPPLNMFRQDPLSSSKLECKLTGLTINKSEEHIWKHMSGKRFLNMLEKFESEKEIPNGVEGNPDDGKEGVKTKKENEDGSLKEEKNKKKKKKEKKKNKKEEKNVDEIVNEVRDSAGKSSDTEDEDDFWMPPEGERWDQDDGGDRWSDGSESAPEDDDDDDDVQEDAGDEEAEHEASELSNGTKRMSLETDPDPTCSAPKTKKRKTKAC